ncbi:MAG TPA: hypothetical protein VLV18_06060 [Terriglobales bacterium]|nr:hypothetical protein [Terriglobales bacterium]
MKVYRHVLMVLALAITLILIARAIEGWDLPSQEFIKTGLLNDKICYMGSYLIVCPLTAPPYETALIILTALFLVAVWIMPRRQKTREKVGASESVTRPHNHHHASAS